MATFHERFQDLYDERKQIEKSNKRNLGYNSLGIYFAEMGINVGSTALSGYYNDPNSNPTLDTLTALADYFGVSVSYLVGESDSRDLKTQSVYQELKAYGFTVDMVDSLKVIQDKPSREKRLCQMALGFLLSDLGSDITGEFPLLKSVGIYLTRLSDTGKRTVSAFDLDNLKQAILGNNLKPDELSRLVTELAKTENEYSIENLDGYYINDIIHELKKVREKLDETEKVIFKEMKQKLKSSDPKKISKKLETLMEDTGEKERNITLHLEE